MYDEDLLKHVTVAKDNHCFVAIYYRHHKLDYEEFETALEAAQFLYDQEMEGNIAYVGIINPQGETIAYMKKIGYQCLYDLGVEQI